MDDPNKDNRLEKTNQRLLEETKNKLEIFEAIHDGIIVFSPRLNIQHINSHAKKLLPLDESFHPASQQIRLFKNRKATISFKFFNWLNSILEKRISKPKEIMVWYSDPRTLKATPLLFSGKVLLSKKGRVKQLLLVVYDRSIYSKATEQKRLMQAAFNSFSGQVIANEKGFIIEANDSFISMSGLSKNSLKEMTIMSWLEKYVKWDKDTQGLLKTILENRYWNGDVEIYSASSHSFNAAMSISMVLDSDHNVEFFIINIQDISEIKEAHSQIEHMAYYDGLTGLANRKLAIKKLSKLIEENIKNRQYNALLQINLDRFKAINDSLGRFTGNRFLKRIAIALRSSLREDDILARIDGDEFIVATQDNEADPTIALEKAKALAIKILDTLDHNFLVDSLTLHCSARIGMLVFPNENDDQPEKLLEKTSLAVNQAKKIASKHRYYVYEKTLTEQVQRKRQMENDLNHACERNEIETFFQAQIDQHKNLYGAEALSRWNHPKKGLISPAEFIPVAEESRLILKIGNWVMVRVFELAKQWTQIKPELVFSINISPIQFHEADFIDHVISCMKETGVNPKNITLELTESVFISDKETALEKIQRLDHIGFKIAIDDFGTGYSSLSYFQKLPIHEIKIDKSFVDKIPASKEDTAIIESIIYLANTKNIKTVAEGVETQKQIDFIHKINSDTLIQGYFYSRPCDAESFEQLFIKP